MLVSGEDIFSAKKGSGANIKNAFQHRIPSCANWLK